jgi:hypothetical protein
LRSDSSVWPRRGSPYISNQDNVRPCIPCPITASLPGTPGGEWVEPKTGILSSQEPLKSVQFSVIFQQLGFQGAACWPGVGLSINPGIPGCNTPNWDIYFKHLQLSTHLDFSTDGLSVPFAQPHISRIAISILILRALVEILSHPRQARREREAP